MDKPNRWQTARPKFEAVAYDVLRPRTPADRCANCRAGIKAAIPPLLASENLGRLLTALGSPPAFFG